MTTEITTTPSTAVVSTATKDWQWITHHLAALVITGVLVLVSVYGVEKLIASRDLAAEQKADARLAVYVSATEADKAASAQTQAQLFTIISQLQTQNSQLQQQKAARDKQTAIQVKNDATLSAQEAAQRLSQQTNAAVNEVTATGDAVTLDLPITRNVVARLDQLATTTSDLADTQTELANETTLFNKSQEANTSQAKVIVDLTAQNTEQVKACAAEVKTLKAQARKSKLKWFGIGYVAGFISGVTAHLW